MDSEKFRKFATGKMKLTVQKEEFEIDMKVSERLPLLNLVAANARAGMNGNNPSERLINDARSSLISAFSRNYIDVDKITIEEFVDKTFETLVSEVSFASGWITKEAIEKAVENLNKKKEEV